MNNGGGFNSAASGSDYSQQNAAQYALSGLTSSGAGNVVLCATASADMVGNVFKCTGGTNFTVGWFEITSVSVGVSFTCSTNAAGTAVTTGVGASGTGNIGGSLSLNSSSDSTWFAQTQAGNMVWIKNGSFTLGQAVSAFNGGTQAPIVIAGYNTSRGDNPTGSNRPTIANGANTLTTGTNVWLKNIIFTGTGVGIVSLGASGLAVNCKFSNNSTTAARSCLTVNGANTTIWNCEVISYRGIAISQGSSAHVEGCYIHDSDIGIKNSGAVASVYINNIISDNVTAAIQISSADTAVTTVWNCTLYGAENKRGTGISLATGTTLFRVLNSIVYGFTTGISHADTTQTVSYDDYNAFFNNTADASGWTKGSNDIALNPSFSSVAQITGTGVSTSGSVLTDNSANFSTVTDNVDFVYISAMTGGNGTGKYLITGHTNTTITTDLALGSGSGVSYQITTGHNFAVGTNMKAVAFPGLFQAGLTTGYMDIGAVQREGGTSTDPGVANVLNGTNYVIDDQSLTGTLMQSSGGGNIENKMTGRSGFA